MRPAARGWLLAALLAAAGAPHAQDPGPVHPAPYLPSPQVTVDEMLRLAEVGPADHVVDLGSGDGRVVIAAAAKFGARAVGYEIDPELVELSNANAVRAGVADRVRFLRQDLFAADLGAATVIAMYLSPNLNLRLRPALLRLKAGTRVVSHGSDLGDWKPDRRTAVRKDVFLWVVPARVDGRWGGEFGERRRRLELLFEQRYQEISASATLDGVPVESWEARLAGERMSVVLVESAGRPGEAALYVEGRVRGAQIEGTVARGVGADRRVETWRAERLAR